MTQILPSFRSNVVWGGGVLSAGGAAPTISLQYPTISLHAIQREPSPALYMVLNYELRLVSAQHERPEKQGLEKYRNWQLDTLTETGAQHTGRVEPDNFLPIQPHNLEQDIMYLVTMQIHLQMCMFCHWAEGRFWSVLSLPAKFDTRKNADYVICIRSASGPALAPLKKACAVILN